MVKASFFALSLVVLFSKLLRSFLISFSLSFTALRDNILAL
jgi:hypothetical protein